LRRGKAGFLPHPGNHFASKGFPQSQDVWYRSRPIIRQESIMKWTAPKVVEICVGMEINCYACAEL